MKKLLIFILFVLSLESKEKVVVDYWTPFSGGDARPMQFIVDKFNASQDEIVVNMSVIEWAKYYPKLTNAINAKTPPDIAIVHSSKLSEFVVMGALNPIENYETSKNIDWSDFIESVLDDISFGDLHYAVPIDRWLLLTYYNKKYLSDAGLLKENGDLKIKDGKDGVVEFFKILKDSIPKGIVGLGQPIDNVFPFWIWFSLYNQIEGGGGYIKHNQVAFDNESALKALEFLVELRDSGIYSNQINDLQGYNMFKYQKSAVMLTGVWATWNFEQNKELDFGVAPFIKVFDKNAVVSDSHALAIPKGGDKKKNEAAIKFANFVTKNGLDWSLAGHVPISKKVRDSKEYLAQPIRSKYKDYLEYGVSFPKHAKLWRCNDKLIEIFADMMQTKKGAKETLEKAKLEVERILEEK